jgi:hypothetical protein
MITDTDIDGLNPKSEARNPKQIQSTKFKRPKQPDALSRSFPFFCYLNLFRISDFVLRISRFAIALQSGRASRTPLAGLVP